MASNFGWKASIAVVINTLGVSYLFRKELGALSIESPKSLDNKNPVPPRLVVGHFAFLIGVVVYAHHPAVFMGIFFFYLGVAHAYERHQDRLILKEALLVVFFLAGLVVLGGQQQWWLQPLLMRMSSDVVFVGAIGLAAFTDNAALTYLGSLLTGLSDEFKYSLVAGAVTGGGLTIIANAPNPAGISILRQHFDQGAVNPLSLLVARYRLTLLLRWISSISNLHPMWAAKINP